ncbi:ornithine carbamoyltransferase [Candidatus Bathyarchaeota archaeon]|nr:ornithine carbamoyltransferase [Candidatus Bathyarchaeota archaeon]
MGIRESFRGLDILTLQELSSEQIAFLLGLAMDMKERVDRYEGLLKGKVLAMIFEKPSTRTRVSFEVAMYKLGGYALNLRWDELQLSRGEPIKDTARVLSRYVDAIMARVYKHSDLEELAKYASIPVINGLSDLWHPCQILADLLTIKEVKGGFRGVKLAYIGDGNNVCNTLLVGCSKVGVDVSVACPRGYEPSPRALEWAYENSRISGSKVEVLENPVEAVKNADVVYTDVFISMGFESEAEERRRIFLPRYRVDAKLMSYAKPDAVFMHCLPAHRDEEVDEEVLEGKSSVVWLQAENRLYAQMALLYLILG